MENITVKWNSKNGGTDRTKTISSERLDEYLSYGWTVVTNEPLPVENPVEVSIVPAVEVKEPVKIKPVVIKEVKKQRGRPRR